MDFDFILVKPSRECLHDRSFPERGLVPPSPMYPNTILAQWLSLS